MGTRHKDFGWWKDQQGAVINGETLLVSLTGTSTVAVIYDASSGGSVISGGAITLSSVGYFEYWVDEDDYATTQKFRNSFAGAKFKSLTLDEIVIFPGITASSSDTFTNKSIDADDNTISNLEIGVEVSATTTSDIDMAGNNLDDGGVIFLIEQAEADGDVAGSGQIWVDLATPNVLYFTDDAGTDFRISYTPTGTGNVVLATSPTIVTPIIVSFVNAAHDHADAVGGGLLVAALGQLLATDITLTGSAAATPDANTITKDHLIGARCTFNGTGTPAYIEEINFTGAITDNGAGDYTLTIDRDFANANYAAIGNVNNDGGSAVFMSFDAKATGSIQVLIYTHAGASADIDDNSVILSGAQ